IFFASLVAYVAGQLVDIGVFQFAKRMTQSRHIWLRSTGSTLISQLIDTVLVTTIAFSSKLTHGELRDTVISQYVVKVLFAVALTPIIYAIPAVLPRRRHLEEQPAELQRVHVDSL